MPWLKNNWMPVLLALAALYAMHQFTLNQSQKEITELRLDGARIADEKRRLDETVVSMILETEALLDELQLNQKTIAANLDSIADLKKSASENQLQIRQINTSSKELALFVETFPEFANAKGFGVIEVKAESGVTRSYLSMPLFFVETFIIEHKNLKAAQEELAIYKENESIYGDVRALRSKVDQQSNRIRRAIEASNNECHVRTKGLRERYVEQLEKPRFGLPSGAKMLGCAAIGLGGAWAFKKAW